MMRNFAVKLAAALSQPLPGPDSQRIMEPSFRGAKSFLHEYTAAVLIGFFYSEGKWGFPLIHRAEDGYVHSGQIGFPGGRAEPGETMVETALREAWEEIGLNPDHVDVIGRLSPLPIPVSRFMVHPIVGVINHPPELKKNPAEVRSVFIVSIDELLNPEIIQYENRQLKQQVMRVPFFKMHKHKVWGATAMILSELKSVLESIRPSI